MRTILLLAVLIICCKATYILENNHLLNISGNKLTWMHGQRYAVYFDNFGYFYEDDAGVHASSGTNYSTLGNWEPNFKGVYTSFGIFVFYDVDAIANLGNFFIYNKNGITYYRNVSFDLPLSYHISSLHAFRGLILGIMDGHIIIITSGADKLYTNIAANSIKCSNILCISDSGQYTTDGGHWKTITPRITYKNCEPTWYNQPSVVCNRTLYGVDTPYFSYTNVSGCFKDTCYRTVGVNVLYTSDFRTWNTIYTGTYTDIKLYYENYYNPRYVMRNSDGTVYLTEDFTYLHTMPFTMPELVTTQIRNNNLYLYSSQSYYLDPYGNQYGANMGVLSGQNTVYNDWYIGGDNRIYSQITNNPVSAANIKFVSIYPGYNLGYAAMSNTGVEYQGWRTDKPILMGSDLYDLHLCGVLVQVDGMEVIVNKTPPYYMNSYLTICGNVGFITTKNVNNVVIDLTFCNGDTWSSYTDLSGSTYGYCDDNTLYKITNGIQSIIQVNLMPLSDNIQHSGIMTPAPVGDYASEREDGEFYIAGYTFDNIDVVKRIFNKDSFYIYEKDPYNTFNLPTNPSYSMNMSVCSS